MSESRQYVATVEKVEPNGRHGPYVLTTVGGLGPVTFSLGKSVWEEENAPEPGEMVVLSHLVKKRLGWRARKSRYFQPEDQV